MRFYDYYKIGQKAELWPEELPTEETMQSYGT